MSMLICIDLVHDHKSIYLIFVSWLDDLIFIGEKKIKPMRSVLL